ncbi:fumarylacetoacetate hydrolase family protein [Tenuibacillus multivorans]|uniref:2-keto-4-pentenoate hydratase/2-oxohepta-3-ene-1,7-dioic acid hydratase (Catechol pathway) n=1 Tax=Tenuibacillus multivorans TaxID=237069 RepID=A0A1H0C2C9_9BACI|nr:fumarylacetoacetate hydrolase family protein [Tenuibacillus multivorans]GEL77741.1 hypothetical protein TMU01_19760 [Tenuibacillus multivorans]SDN52068.1 2-keto-4-pentenoate hydratase/2-oxohepta-3-ene-1,7-dioic acid hydratase (catechol pathway) [Tenuibacillus multivorans]
MKLLTFKQHNHIYWGVKKDEKIYYSEQLISYFPTLLSVIENINYMNLEQDLNRYVNLDEVQLLPPYIPNKNIMCIGKNYREHAMEMTKNDPKSVPEHPVIFTKSPSTVVGHGDMIESHSNVTEQIDYEGELAVIIGKRGRNIKRQEALDYIFGYTILNDVTARDLQKRHQQFYRGKSLDTFAPMGPFVVTRDDISDVQSLSVKTYVNDELRQDGNTTDMIFPVDQLVEALSQGMTLEPGDIIATGTPSGVGKGFNPPKFLRSGDRVRIEVEGIGELENKVD